MILTWERGRDCQQYHSFLELEIPDPYKNGKLLVAPAATEPGAAVPRH